MYLITFVVLFEDVQAKIWDILEKLAQCLVLQHIPHIFYKVDGHRIS